MSKNWQEINTRLAAINDLEAPTRDQIREAQQILADAGLLPQVAVTGEETLLYNMVLSIADDSDLAAKVVAKTRDFEGGNAPPEYVMAAEAALTRLGYDTPITGDIQASSYTTSLANYRQNHPLPLSPQQLEMMTEEIGGRIALEVDHNHVRAKVADVPGMTTQALDSLRQKNLIPQNLSDLDRDATITAIQDQLSAKAIQIPDLKSSVAISAPHAVVMRISPDQISEGSFYTQRLAERAAWEMENKAIAAAGANVITIDGADASGGKREVFTRDRFVMVGGTAYLPDVRKYGEIYGAGPDSQAYKDYESEIDQARAHLMRAGVATVDVKGAWFEGGNIVQHPQSRTLFMGIEPGRDTDSATALIDAVNTHSAQGARYAMVAVPMTGYDPQGIYHLDLALSEQLPGGKVLFDRSITDDHTAEKIAETFGQQNIIPITNEEAISGAANILLVNQTAVLTREMPRVQDMLEQAGIRTLSAQDFERASNPLLDEMIQRDQFMYGNGGMRCMGQVIGNEVSMINVYSPRMDMAL